MNREILFKLLYMQNRNGKYQKVSPTTVSRKNFSTSRHTKSSTRLVSYILDSASISLKASLYTLLPWESDSFSSIIRCLKRRRTFSHVSVHFVLCADRFLLSILIISLSIEPNIVLTNIRFNSTNSVTILSLLQLVTHSKNLCFSSAHLSRNMFFRIGAFKASILASSNHWLKLAW